ncbi:phosphoenolpyruvate--protein phosphotransferase [Larsenimonas rhizosphaerae]|uniref:phosphoenolpyruvate--protein phosphotransferase n=1 Tax=Larsenimonas rhizosphaerae TaxID=2944682 RepID=UPI002033B304|nr:phosphoenolpyruvate--protein phosphotransferase [Larsenimonas rhizosphaerae]MCM2132192.1 phosphoenolpyruvate--protein phosphotransferase [Larsenimonas rhizosphaerae]
MILTAPVGWALELLPAPGDIVRQGEPLFRLALSEEAPPGAAPSSTPGQTSTRTVTVALEHGLHARPAARLRRIASQHQVTLTLATDDHPPIDSASLSGLLNMGILCGTDVTLTAAGYQASTALDAAVHLLGQPDTTLGPEAPAEADHAVSADTTAAGQYTGLPASPGLIIGPLVTLSPALPNVPERGDTPDRERAALDKAIRQARDSLARAMTTASQAGRQEEADVFEAHRAWLDDPTLLAAAHRHIDDGFGGGEAWRRALDAEAATLAASLNPLLAARVNDLRDLQQQVMQHFATSAPSQAPLPPGAILISHDMTPSAFAAIAQSLGGLCLAAGGTTSHVAIMARARGLPCIVACGEALLQARGERACLDAEAGILESTPTPERLEALERQLSAQQDARERIARHAHQPATTRDGHTVQVAANIGSAEEAALAAAHGADGIGLFRSELLFLERDAAPSAPEQQTVYTTVVQAMEGAPVIIRTLDIGADKQLPYLTLPETPNPALGIRGVRLWAHEPELLDQQLDALLLAARDTRPPHGPPTLRIMVPMISDVAEFMTIKTRLAERAGALEIDALPELGAMIEVPSAALSPGLARAADFLSIGTNDLAQYTLAMDRESPALAARMDVLHPAVLRLIKLCIEGAHGHCPVGVCGASASDPLAAAVLVALGIDELSVEPARIGTIKDGLRQLNVSGLAALLPDLLTMDSAEAVRQTVSAHLATTKTTSSREGLE